MSIPKKKPIYKKKGNYSPIPKSRIEKGAKTIIALRGCDWNKIPRKEIRKLHKKIGAVLALDDVALGHAVKHGMDVLILEDFLSHDELVEIYKQAVGLTYSWHTEVMKEHTFDGINFAQIDEVGLYWVWQQILSAYACAKKINDKNLHVILIDEVKNNVPMFTWKNEIFCKVCSEILDSYSIITFKNKINYNHSIKKYAFSLKSPIDNKPIVTQINYELRNSSKLLAKLMHVHNGLSILPSDFIYTPNDFYSYKTDALYKNNNFKGIPVHEVTEIDDNTCVNTFMPAFESFKNTIDFLPYELHSLIYQELEYYYTKRYPEFLSKYYSYKELFSKHIPACVFGTDLFFAESQLALLAANTLGIPTFTLGHSLIQYFDSYNKNISTHIVHTAQGLRNAIANNIPKDRLLLIKDQGELDFLYEMEAHAWDKKNNTTKILVLPYRSKQYGTSCCEINYYRQMENVKTLCSPPKHLNVDIKFKEHPGVVSQGFFPLLNINEKKLTFPKNYNLSYLIDAADICILLGEIGCALLHTSKKKPTLFVTYAMFDLCNTANDYPNKVDNPKDIWPWIEKFLSDESYKKAIMEKQEQFHYIDENTLTFEQAMEEKLL